MENVQCKSCTKNVSIKDAIVCIGYTHNSCYYCCEWCLQNDNNLHNELKIYS